MPSHRFSADPSCRATVDEERQESGITEKLLTTRELFKAGPEILIQHGDETYRLRITRAGKLILTK